jgi:hypothetical protein
MEAILHWAKDKENSQQERTNPFVHRSYLLFKDRFMPGEEDGFRDDFLGDVHSVRHIAAVPRRQVRHARARQPAVRASAPRRRIANACQSTIRIRLRQRPITLDKPRLTRPATLPHAPRFEIGH